jgi:hypothetical protein
MGGCHWRGVRSKTDFGHQWKPSSKFKSEAKRSSWREGGSQVFLSEETRIGV